MKTSRTLIITAALAAGLLLPAISQARVSVSIGVGLPVVPVYAAPVYAAPVYAPPPVVVEPAPVVVEPAPVYYGYGGPRYVPAPPPYYYHHHHEWREDPHWGPHDGPHGGPHGWR